MSSHLASSIKRYLNSRNDPYTILIAGDWGCGKTYFAQSRIKEIADSLGKKIVYLSLFGIESKEDFERSLLIRLLPLSDSTSRIAKVSLSIFKAKTNLDARGILSIWNGVSENTLLIIDDLERVGDISVITSVIGIISNLVHEKSAKAIFIGNEDEILRQDESNKYSKWKEKSIRYTYKYQIDSESIGAIVVDELAKLDSELLSHSKAEELVRKVVGISSCFNLRTYLRSIDQFSQFVELLKAEVIFSEDATYDLLLTIFALNIEYSIDTNIRNVLFGVFSESNYLKLFADSSSESEISRKFLAKYFGPKHRGFTRIPQVFHAVFDGVWDEASIKKSFVEEYSGGKGAISKLLLTDFRALSDSEFKTATDELIEQLRQRKFNESVELVTIANLLFYFSQNKLIQMSSGNIKVLLENCLDGMPLTAFMNELSSGDFSLIFGGSSRVQNEDHRVFLEYFKEKWNKYYREKVEKKKQQLIKGLASNIEPFVDALFSVSSELSRQSVFTKSDAISIFSNLKKMNGDDVVRFTEAIMYRYKGEEAFPSQFSGEVDFVEALRDELQKNLFSLVPLRDDAAEVQRVVTLSELELRDLYEKLDELLISRKK